jgi:hypothetical protein
LDLVFLNAAPVSVRNYVNRDFHPPKGQRVSGYGFSLTQYFNKLNVSLQHYQFFSVGLFREFMRNELTLPATGQYVFFHLALPHPPNVYDANLNYLGPDSGKNPGYPDSMAMHEAALHLLNQFVEVLHQTEHFENATIIIHGDHGRWWAFPPELAAYANPNGALKEPATSLDKDAPTTQMDDHAAQATELASRTSALLLVKLGGAPVNGVIQTPDISATILRHFGLSDARFSGVALQEPSAIQGRTTTAFFADSSDTASLLHTRIPKFELHDRRFVFKEDVNIK